MLLVQRAQFHTSVVSHQLAVALVGTHKRGVVNGRVFHDLVIEENRPEFCRCVFASILRGRGLDEDGFFDSGVSLSLWRAVKRGFGGVAEERRD